MASILDILGQSRNNSLAPAGGYDQYSGPAPSGPAAAPVGTPSSSGGNPFSSIFASDSGGITGLIGKLSGAPTGGEMVQSRLGAQQAQGLAGLQQRIEQGMPVQQAVTDFIGSPEGTKFFGSSQDPIGAIKGYLQLSQKPADKFSTISPGASVFNESTGQIGAGQPTTEIQNAKGFLDLAKLDPAQTEQFGKAMLSKMSEGTNTQKEAAIGWLVQSGAIDQTTGQKVLAGIIQIQQPRDAAGQPLGPPIAIDLSQMMKTGNPQDAQVTVIGGEKGGAAGYQPAGTPQPDPATGQPGKVSGDIIFGAGLVGGTAAAAGGILGNINPHLAAPEYNSYRTALQTIYADMTNLFDANKTLASEAKLYTQMVDKHGFSSNPIEQAVALSNLLDVVDRRIAFNSAILGSSDPRYTGDVKGKASAEFAALQKLKQDLPDRQALQDAYVRAQSGEGGVQQGIKEGATHVGEAIKSIQDVGNTAIDAGSQATGAAEKAVEGQGVSSGANPPGDFKTAQEALDWANKTQPTADVTVTVNGKQMVIHPPKSGGGK